MDDITHLGTLLPSVITGVLIAIICGGLVGLDLARKRKYSAALRDCVMVCLGTDLFVVAVKLQPTADLTPTGIPAVMIAAIVIATALIGGYIVRISKSGSDGVAVGLSVWVVAAVGLIIGSGYPMLALLVTGITLVTLTLLRGFENQFSGKKETFMLKLTVRDDNPEFRSALNDTLAKHQVQPLNFRSEKTPTGVRLTINATDEPKDIRVLITDIWTLSGVTEIEH